MKKCFACNQEKEINEYYRHPAMLDGHTNKCKECTKSQARKNRKQHIEYYREYDKKRGNRLEKDHCRLWRAKYPNKYKAQTMVGNAIRGKKLFRQPCDVCGSQENIHAHHNDYLKPLNVTWLCAAHHRQWHIVNGEAENP